jgi:hypothetical protein
MTNHKINVAIAEACGWTPDNRGLGWLSPHGYYAPEPDYCSDLNAMHEAEMIFTPESKHWMYYALLDDMCGSSFKAIRATARHRAEAFLRTLGKWKEVAK